MEGVNKLEILSLKKDTKDKSKNDTIYICISLFISLFTLSLKLKLPVLVHSCLVKIHNFCRKKGGRSEGEEGEEDEGGRLTCVQ